MSCEQGPGTDGTDPTDEPRRSRRTLNCGRSRGAKRGANSAARGRTQTNGEDLTTRNRERRPTQQHSEERPGLYGIQEVDGSIPFSSTRDYARLRVESGHAPDDECASSVRESEEDDPAAGQAAELSSDTAGVEAAESLARKPLGWWTLAQPWWGRLALGLRAVGPRPRRRPAARDAPGPPGDRIGRDPRGSQAVRTGCGPPRRLRVSQACFPTLQPGSEFSPNARALSSSVVATVSFQRLR